LNLIDTNSILGYQYRLQPAGIKLLVKALLKSPFNLKWDVQGLGMLRTYLSPELRLHIWDSALQIPNVSPLHTHPWHLRSYVVAGQYKQFRYVEEDSPFGVYFKSATIKCGKDAVCTTEPVIVKLLRQSLETYTEGQTYWQNKDEIHTSLPLDGTITLVERTFTEDRDHARVFWETEFVSAEPRRATVQEIENTTRLALDKWLL
jgi:hypothetical protein